MSLDLTNLIPIYQSAIDDIINQMGKSVILFFYDTVASVNIEFNDPVRPGDIKKPSFKETTTSTAPVVTENIRTIKALLKHDPSNFKKELFGLDINSSTNIVRIKTFLTDVPDLLRCRFIRTNADSSEILRLDYRLVKEPIPIGLSQDRYAISYWARI